MAVHDSVADRRLRTGGRSRLLLAAALPFALAAACAAPSVGGADEEATVRGAETMTRIWDISEPIEPGSAVFPGDTPFSQEWVMRIDEGMSCNVSTIRMTTHLGTHADAPLHYDRDGAPIDRVDLATYIGPCRVLTVETMIGETADERVVDPRSLRDAGIAPGCGVERLLLHTIPDLGHDHTRWNPTFTALGPQAASVAAAAGVRLIGIDTPSMDPPSAKVLKAHHVLRDAGIAVLENLDLSGVPDGDGYELVALPLRIVGGDSAPVRAILRR